MQVLESVVGACRAVRGAGSREGSACRGVGGWEGGVRVRGVVGGEIVIQT